jgi:ABC-type Fe3+-hydroxamate transport system substrate-binding protein
MLPFTSADRTDSLGIEHAVACGDVRLVSLVPSLTELLFTLGLGHRLVGRTTYCIHPAELVRDIPSVGGTKKLRMERLRDLRPTHVIANIEENWKSDIETLQQWGIQVVVTYPRAPEDNLPLFRLLGSVFSRASETSKLCSMFEAQYEKLVRQKSKFEAQKVLYLIWRKPWMSVSRDTYIGKMLELVNWHTPYDDPDNRYPEVQAGDKALYGVHQYLFSSEPFPFKNKHLREFSTSFDVPEDNLTYVDGELMSWYGSRALHGLAYLEKLAQKQNRTLS